MKIIRTNAIPICYVFLRVNFFVFTLVWLSPSFTANPEPVYVNQKLECTLLEDFISSLINTAPFVAFSNVSISAFGSVVSNLQIIAFKPPNKTMNSILLLLSTPLPFP